MEETFSRGENQLINRHAHAFPGEFLFIFHILEYVSDIVDIGSALALLVIDWLTFKSIGLLLRYSYGPGKHLAVRNLGALEILCQAPSISKYITNLLIGLFSILWNT
ncbi:hypothetical protein NPIL_169671 [Nephila pilipes]|uniref:Uncharacterized protein n=1 Tax=Nephila pilipes TaxID=299642 RepID=A0A8X6INP1_NEPPI|nr:hypothetical protein NPIL_169671 [Nephila pilipes]